MNRPTETAVPDTPQTLHDLLAEIETNTDAAITSGWRGRICTVRHIHFGDHGFPIYTDESPSRASMIKYRAMIVAWVQAECERRDWRWTAEARDYDGEYAFTITSDLDLVYANYSANSLAVAALSSLAELLAAEVAS